MYTVAAATTTIRKDLINIFWKLEKNERAEGERKGKQMKKTEKKVHLRWHTQILMIFFRVYGDHEATAKSKAKQRQKSHRMAKMCSKCRAKSIIFNG